MKVAYIYDGFYPSTGADAWQVLNTALALSKQGLEVTIFCAQALDEKILNTQGILEHYSLNGQIEIRQLKRSPLLPRFIHKWNHCRQAIKYIKTENFDLVYSRNILAIHQAIKAGLKAIYDTYRPWPKQYAIMRWQFKSLFKNPLLLGGFFDLWKKAESHPINGSFLCSLIPRW